MTNHEQVLHELQNVRRALDQSAIVAITDARGVITHVNDKFVEISKFPREELIGSTHKILNSGYHPEQFFQEMWQTISSGQIWQGEIQNRSKDGGRYWVQTVIVPFRDQNGKIQEYVSIRYDITGKKESEHNLRNLIEAAFEGLIIYDLSGHILWANGLAAEILSRSEGGLRGTYMKELLPSLEMFQIGSWQLKNDDENKHAKMIEATVKHYSHLNHRAYLVVLKDITEKIQLEAQILQQDRLASIGLLASGLAHEIGTPLGIVRGRAEMLLSRAQDEKIHSGLNIIITQIDRISGLIQNLLGLARGNVAARPGPTALRQVLEDVSTLLSHEITRNKIELDIDVPESAGVFAVYPSLYQVILNLMVNAIHAVKQKYEHEDKFAGSIKIRADKVGSFWKLRIQDNGCGIPEENFTKLFTPFFTTKDVGVGTGLGLATSFKIISAWGGKIEVESKLGHGASFIVTLKEAVVK